MAHIYSKREKSVAFYKYSSSRLNGIAQYLLYFTIWLITKVMVTLSCISSGLELWSVNHTSIYAKTESRVFKSITFLGEISKNWPHNLLVTKLYKTLEFSLIIVVKNITMY